MGIPLEGIQPKFQCSQCGKCCTQWFSSQAHESELREQLLKQEGPIYQVSLGLVVSLFEAERLRKEAEERKIVFPLQWGMVAVDAFLDEAIGVEYAMPSTPCPFLQPNKQCGVYENRPITCRVFPAPLIFRFANQGGNIEIGQSFCGSDHFLEAYPFSQVKGVSKQETFRRYFEYFGDHFIASAWRYLHNRFAVGIVQSLENKALFSGARHWPFEKVTAFAPKARSVFEVAVEKGLLSEGEIKQWEGRLSFEKARELVESNIREPDWVLPNFSWD